MDLVDGRLDVLGSPGKDDVVLRLDPSGRTVEVDDRTNGAGTDHRFAATAVKAFHVDLGAGDDWVIFDDSNGSLSGRAPLDVDGGDGDNVIRARRAPSPGPRSPTCPSSCRPSSPRCASSRRRATPWRSAPSGWCSPPPISRPPRA
ncbi:MAG: hypothetical protein U0470_02680 [Anaerolineae bacterium]